ncbi:hypothetical protein [Sphingobacterium haloxyli]|nr:hypothetical protein [Sphingobacterium haloxyli]
MKKLFKFATLALLLQFDLIAASDLILEVVSTDALGLLETPLYKHSTYYF